MIDLNTLFSVNVDYDSNTVLMDVRVMTHRGWTTWSELKTEPLTADDLDGIAQYFQMLARNLREGTL